MKTGIFFSQCDGVFDGAVDLQSLAASYADYPSVKIFKNFFEANEFSSLLKEVETKNLDSVVLVGESPYSFLQTRNSEYLYKCLSDRGVNRNKVEIVNLKNMVARPHGLEKEKNRLNEKSKLLIDMGIEKIKGSHDIGTVEVSPRKAVAIIGANSPGFAAAQLLLDEGYKVFLINDKHDISIPGEESPHMQPTVTYVMLHRRFTLFNDAATEDFFGYPGDYVLKISSGGKETELPVGAVALSLQGDTAMIKALKSSFHIDIKEDGSLAVLDEVSSRALTQDRGIFVIDGGDKEKRGLSSGLTAADAAAAMAINMLNRKEIYHTVKVSEVNPELCSGCGACVKTCMFQAVQISGSPRISHIDPKRCRGCGNCVTACPADARDLVSTPSNYLYNAVQILSRFRAKGKSVLLIACEGCGYRCLDSAAEAGLKWPIEIMPLKVICGGQIDTQLIMHAFVMGFDGVVLAICGEGCCHNIIGNVDLERRANLFRVILESRGINHERMKIISTCSRSGKECVDNLNQFFNWITLSGKDQDAETVVIG